MTMTTWRMEDYFLRSPTILSTGTEMSMSGLIG